MKVAGSATLHAPREAVWKALNDPAVLVRTIPGCQRLEEIGDDAYAMTISAGVASIKGVYQGEVRLTEQQPLDSFVLKAAGSGAPGTVSADVLVTLSEVDEATTSLAYDADAIVGGMIGGVGQRMLGGVAKKTAGEFFSAVDDVLTGKAAAPEPATSAATGADVASTPAAGVYEAPTPAGAPPAPGFLVGVVVGAAAALAGAVVGGWLARRRG
jgi:carbon monoxide dehydrogenase subunit G